MDDVLMGNTEIPVAIGYSLLSAQEIADLCTGDNPIIAPFVATPTREANGVKVISYGLSSMGYDIRIGTKFKRPISGTIDPKTTTGVQWEEFETDQPFVLLPNSSILGVSVEEFQMPSDVLGLPAGKSSYARSGVLPYVTPLEPAWRGWLTMQVANVTNLPVMIYPNEGITQVLFFRSMKPRFTYADKGGKYQDQGNAPTSSLA